MRLARNELTTLPAGLFDHTLALESLELSENAITTLPDGLFNGLSLLETLSLFKNVLATVATDAFDDLLSLDVLGLSDNLLSTLPAGLFEGLEVVRLLGLDGNADLQCAPATDALSLSVPDGVDETSICECPSEPTCDEEGNACECQPGSDGYSCVGSSSDGVIRAFSCPSSVPTPSTPAPTTPTVATPAPTNLIPATTSPTSTTAVTPAPTNPNPATPSPTSTTPTTSAPATPDPSTATPATPSTATPTFGIPATASPTSTTSAPTTQGLTTPAPSTESLVDAAVRTTVTVEATGYDKRLEGYGCSPDGCTADNTRDDNPEDNSRWSCKGDLVEDLDGLCCIEYFFAEPQDIVRVDIAFYKGTERTRTLNVYNDGDFFSQIESSGSSDDYEAFPLNTGETTDFSICLHDPNSTGDEWLSITEVKFMVN